MEQIIWTKNFLDKVYDKCDYEEENQEQPRSNLLPI